MQSSIARPHRRRSQRGSMLTMTILCVLIILIVCMVAFGGYLLFTQQERQQTVADNIALSLAKAMNEGDRIGQMNNLVGLNRELVYSSRLVANATLAPDLYFCSPLAGQLLSEAKASSVEIEKAQAQQIDLARAAIRYQVDNYNLNTKNQPLLHLPWWQSYDPQIYQVNLGSINRISSNVLHNDVFPVLNDYDKSDRHYVDLKSNLYFGNIKATLPEPDSDLNFRFASLPAPVDSTVSPARLANGEVYKSAGPVFESGKYVMSKFDQIPTAVQVVATMKVAANDNKGELMVGSVAACNGALHPLPSPETSMNMMAPPKP